MTAAACQVDHLVVTAPTLAAGVAWVESILGSAPEVGGEHVKMGTHNALLRLGDSIYLEVIAANPAAPAPGRPRWFELDRLEGGTPRLATWVARTDDIRSAASSCGYSFGPVETMSRGRFTWDITVPVDGSLLGGGSIPMLIQWAVADHPAAGLPDLGCRLAMLELVSSDPGFLSGLLECLGVRAAVVVRDLLAGHDPHVVAQIETPRGMRSLSG